MEDINYEITLSEIFPYLSKAQVLDTIAVVLEENNDLTAEEKLLAMSNILADSAGTLEILEFDSDDDNSEGATGLTQSSSGNHLDQHYDNFIKLFPDISPTYLADICQGYDPFDFDSVVADLARDGYVKIDKDPIDIWEHLKQMLPNADPIFLRNQARVLVQRPDGELEEFIANAIENHDYPSMKEYLKNQEIKAELEVYTKNFSVTEYLQRVPDPIKLYSDANRVTLSDGCEEDTNYVLNFLYNQFRFIRTKQIDRVFKHFKQNLKETCNKLKVLPKAFRTCRPIIEPPECTNIKLLQEISFFKHETAIKQYIKRKDEKYRVALEEARLGGLLQTCGCCYDDQLIPEECYFCDKGCIFCKECVKTGAEHVMGKAETVFPCLAQCDSFFNYSTLQMILDKKIFQRVWHRRQIEEIRNANLIGLENCPHCDFCMIPNENDKIFKCENIDCMKETCRLCQNPAHVPLRCEEIEYDEDVQRRVFIENKMTEALLRKCWKCSKQFYKESGCNKMTCICGALMCYVCGSAVNSYSHFNNTSCPLYTENLQEFHLRRVREGAEAAKNELGITRNPALLKFDPTINLESQVA